MSDGAEDLTHDWLPTGHETLACQVKGCGREPLDPIHAGPITDIARGHKDLLRPMSKDDFPVYREGVIIEVRELSDRIALLREALTLALGVIDGSSTRPVHDLIIARATLYETAPLPAEPTIEKWTATSIERQV